MSNDDSNIRGRIDNLIEEGEVYKEDNYDSIDFAAWKNKIELLLGELGGQRHVDMLFKCFKEPEFEGPEASLFQHKNDVQRVQNLLSAVKENAEMSKNNSNKIDTKHQGDRTQIVDDSKNVIQPDISGSGNIVTIEQKVGTDSFDIPVKGNGLVELGRFLFDYLGTKKFNLLMLISSITPASILIDQFKTNFLPQNSYLLVFSIVWLVLTFYILGVYIDRSCKNCRKSFAYKQTKATHLESGEYEGQMHHKVRYQYKCDFCGHEKEEKVLESEDAT